MGHASLEPGGGYSLGLNDILCGVVWRWLDVAQETTCVGMNRLVICKYVEQIPGELTIIWSAAVIYLTRSVTRPSRNYVMQT